MKFTFETELSVQPPYRLDLTVDALRRLAANVVDIAADGTYRRALEDTSGRNLLDVRQIGDHRLSLRVAGPRGERWLPTATRMLGVHVRLDEWYRRVADIPWLARLAAELRGLRPPRYPTLWEALAHAIVFQQISIHAAAAIMRRTVELLSPPVDFAGARYFPFMTPHSVLSASDATLRSVGLSANKVAHLRSAAGAILDGDLDEGVIDSLESPAAAARLSAVRGIGAWSASVVLLRGLGRLDVFPLRDSGVARAIEQLAGVQGSDTAELLEALGPVRGMLYFHLLLGRLRGRQSAP